MALTASLQANRTYWPGTTELTPTPSQREHGKRARRTELRTQPSGLANGGDLRMEMTDLLPNYYFPMRSGFRSPLYYCRGYCTELVC